MNLKQMEKSAQDAAGFLRALANESRLMILCQLVDGEKSVGELCELLKLRQANVSQQLALLRREGLVRPRREAQSIYYSLAGVEVEAVIALLYDLFCSPPKRKSRKPVKQSVGR